MYCCLETGVEDDMCEDCPYRKETETETEGGEK